MQKRPLAVGLTVDVSEGDSNLSRYRQNWSRGSIDAQTQAWLDRDARAFLHQSLSTPCLNVLVGCAGSKITDLNGRQFLDFHGNSVHQVGFGNPDVIAAIKNQLDTLSFCTRRYTNIPAVRLAEKLGQICPGDLNKVLFAPGGTSAVGMALKLARVVTGRFKTLSMWGAFHGASLDAISVGGEALFRRGIGPLLPGTEHVPPADPAHCPWDPAGRCETCGLKCAQYVDYVLSQEGDVAAVIAEPIRCTTINSAPAGYWSAVREACSRHGALLIFDETAVCLGRTGRMFACEHEFVVPDILILGKGLGGGIFPLAAIMVREAFDQGQEMALGHYTHEKNPVACAAGLAAIHYIETHGLVARSETLGRHALACLNALRARHSMIADVRGRGLLFGAEMRAAPDARYPSADVADFVMYESLKQGLSFKVSGGCFLTLTPPLTVTDAELDRAFAILDAALALAQPHFSAAI